MQEGQGITLDRYVSERGPLDPARALRVAFQITQELAQAGPSAASHAIYPGRILLERSGTIRLLPPPAEELALPSMLEYPAYASPEEIRGSPADVRSSLYSLGCTIFELLTGRPPYGGDDARAILRAHLDAPIPDLRAEAPAVPEGLAATVRDLLEKDPELRIQSAEELLRRLRQAAGGAPRRAGQAPAAPAPRRGPPPRPAPAPRRVPSPRPGPGARGAARPSLGSRRHASALRTGTSPGAPRVPRAAGRGRLDPLEDDFESEEDVRRAIPQRKGYPFTIGGAALGLVVGLAIVLVRMREASKIPEEEAAVVAARAAELQKNRKQAFLDELSKKGAAVEAHLKAVRALPDEKKRDRLIEALRQEATSPRAYLLGATLAELGPAPGTPGASTSGAEDPEVTKEFQAILAEAERLYAAGKIGEAAKAIYEDNRLYPRLTRAQKQAVDEKKAKWEEEIAARWERDKAEIQRLSGEGEGEKAIEVARAALVYGDSMLRREAERLISSLQDQLDLQRSTSLKEEPEEGTDLDDLEREAEEFQKKASKDGSEGGSAEGAQGEL